MKDRNQIYNRSDFSQIMNETHQISGHKVTISTGAGSNLFVTIYN
ncbi:hypothetical protein [Clostridium psychrophilum]|nr:hypothetical protein [Clostridium psychrophilum]